MARRVSQYVVEALVGAAPNVINGTTSNTFAMTFDVTPLPGTERVSATMALSLDVTAMFARDSVSLEMPLSFVTTGVPGALFGINTQYVNMQFAATPVDLFLEAKSTFALAFAVTEQNLFTVTVNEYDFALGFQMRTTPKYGIANVSASGRFNLDLVAGRYLPVTASNTLSMTFATYRAESITNTFALSFDCNKYGQGCDNVFAMNFGIATQWIGTASATATFALASNFGFWNVSTDLCQYDPFVLSGSEVSATPPTLTLAETVTFTSTSGTLTVRAPKLADREESNTTRIYRTSLTGDLIVFADPQWPKSTKLTLEFEALSAAKADEFFEFLQTNIGLSTVYVDYYGQSWTGIILTPDAEFYQTDRSSCTYGTSIQFEGSLT